MHVPALFTHRGMRRSPRPASLRRAPTPAWLPLALSVVLFQNPQKISTSVFGTFLLISRYPVGEGVGWEKMNPSVGELELLPGRPSRRGHPSTAGLGAGG